MTNQKTLTPRTGHPIPAWMTTTPCRRDCCYRSAYEALARDIDDFLAGKIQPHHMRAVLAAVETALRECAR
jgi:hypothetical protein